MESAGYREKFILRVSAFMTSTISWLRMKIRTPSLKTGVISSITLTAPFIFSCPLSTSTAAWQSLRRSSISIRRRMILMTSVWNTKMLKTSWQKETTVWCVQIYHFRDRSGEYPGSKTKAGTYRIRYSEQL